MAHAWIDRARRALLASADGPGWPYRKGASLAVEATALACLGLVATADNANDPSHALARRASDWFAALQRPDGSLGVTATLPTPGWATPYALLLWAALGQHDGQRRHAAAWLLAEKVDSPPVDAGPEALRVVGHDTTISGWPWVEGTHSWVEPSAMTVLALGREGMIRRSRCGDALRLLRDREIATGGWNYGNSVVFGQKLRPQPGPTGLALLALAAAGGDAPAVDRASKYLRSVLPDIRASGSLGWGVLGLRAWGCCPAESEAWLEEAATSVLPRDDAAPRLGLLLLAGSDRGLAFLGVSTQRVNSHAI